MHQPVATPERRQPHRKATRPARDTTSAKTKRAEPGPAVRDLVRLEYGSWDARPELRAAFLDGYDRDFANDECQALTCLAALDALSGLQWGTKHDDTEVTGRARATFARLVK